MNETGVPALRFSEFSETWEAKRLGDVLTIGNGRDYKHLRAGDVPVYGTGGLMTFVDQHLYDGDSVCIGRKGTIDAPVLLSGKFWTVDTLFYTHKFSGVTAKFVYAKFLRIKWQRHNEASGVPSLSKSTIEALKEKFPALPEQQKISDFLGAVDARVGLLRRRRDALRAYKKGRG